MAEETFVVIREAMKKAKKAAVARLVLSSRERVVTIGVRDNGMLVQTLRAPQEVRGETAYFEDIPANGADKEMLDLAMKLIEQKAAKFDPGQYKDRYEEALLAGRQGEDRRRGAGAGGGACARQRHQPHGRAEEEPGGREAAGQGQGPQDRDEIRGQGAREEGGAKRKSA